MFLGIYAALALGVLTTFGITGGAHRLWSHRSYRATWQLRLILMIFDSMSFQNSIYEWVRDHRYAIDQHIYCVIGLTVIKT